MVKTLIRKKESMFCTWAGLTSRAVAWLSLGVVRAEGSSRTGVPGVVGVFVRIGTVSGLVNGSFLLAPFWDGWNVDVIVLNLTVEGPPIIRWANGCTGTGFRTALGFGDRVVFERNMSTKSLDRLKLSPAVLAFHHVVCCDDVTTSVGLSPAVGALIVWLSTPPPIGGEYSTRLLCQQQ